MHSTFYLTWFSLVFVFSCLYIFTGGAAFRWFNLKPAAVSIDNAKEAIKHMASFTTWLTGIQTAAMAAMGLLVKGDDIDAQLAKYGYLALLFFGSSIVLATWLLSSLPSLQQSLKDGESVDNDIYMQRLFSFVPFRIGPFTGLIHGYFLIGMVFFALFVLHVIDGAGIK